MPPGESGQTDAYIALPSLAGEALAAVAASPFAPASQLDSSRPGILAGAASSWDPEGAYLPDILGGALGMALIACALLAIRIRGLRSEISRLESDRDSEAAERSRLEGEVARLQQVRTREVEHRTQRLTEENRALQRESQALKERQFRLAYQVERDELTGLKERHAFERALDRELRRAQRSKAPVSVVAWSMDESYMLVQRLGEKRAARVVQRVGATIDSNCHRGGDQAGRIEQNSFAAVLPGTSLADATRLAERVRKSIEELELPNPGSRAAGHLTVSVGLAELDPANGPHASDVLSALEAACTEAARRGGNQIVRVRMEATSPRRAAG